MSKIIFAGGGERTQYLARSSNDSTIRFVLRYPEIVDADALRLAMKAVVESVDVLHGTFFVDGVNAYWRINEDVDESSYFQYVRTQGDPSMAAESLALLPVYPQDQVQMRCVLVHGERASAVVLCISHLCVDGSDGKYLLRKVIEAYNLVCDTGSAQELTVKNGSRAPQQVYEDREWKEKLEMLKLPFSGGTSQYPYPTQEQGMARLTKRVIPADVMDRARKKGKALGATVNDLLLAGCYQVYAAMPEVDETSAICIAGMMDLRRHCKNGESEGLCNMSGGLPTAMPNGVTGTYEETLAEIARQTAAAKEDPLAGLSGVPILYGVAPKIPIGLLIPVSGRIYGKTMPVGITNLGNLECRSLAMGDLIPDGGLFGGPLKKKPGMQISAISFDGMCVLAVVGRYTAQDGAHLQKTLDDLAKLIEEFAGNETQ